MTKSKIALSAMAVLLCGAGLAKAQDYDSLQNGDSSYYGDRGETVIVRPDYDRVEKRQLMGHINGDVNPTELSISRPVNFSDLNLSRDADYIELRERVRDTARDLCAELDARYPDLRGDDSADRECVRSATRSAMREVRGG